MRRALALLIVAAVSCGGGPEALPAVTAAPVPSDTSAGSGFFPSERVTVRFGGGAEVRAEQAVTPEQRARGLMFREVLGDDEGMLFLFERPSVGGFHMKNTLIPLSIAYMRRTANRTYEVMAILDMQPCPAQTVKCPTYPPGTYYDSALEMNEGWFERNGVEPGSTADVEGTISNPFDSPSPTP